MTHRFGRHPTDYDYDEPTQPAEELVERSMEDDHIDALMVDRALARNTVRRLELLEAAGDEPSLDDIQALGRLRAERDEILATARLYGLVTTSLRGPPPAPKVATIRPATIERTPPTGFTAELLHDDDERPSEHITQVPLASLGETSRPSWNTYPQVNEDRVDTDIHDYRPPGPSVRIPTPPHGRPRPPRPNLVARLFRALFPEDE